MILRPPRSAGFVRLLLATLLIASPLPGQTATFTVNNLLDSGAGSLREAITNANGSAGPHVIVFDVPDDSTITLVTSLDDVTEELLIDGSTATNLRIESDGTNPLFRVSVGTTTVRDLDLDEGDLLLTATTIIAFDLSGNENFDESILEDGALEKRGEGQLTLSNTNNYAGGTTVTAGTLVVDTASLPGDVVNNSTLIFDQAVTGAYTGVISGSGRVEKQGADTLSLMGANTYTGGTTITAGTLEVGTSSLPGDVENNSVLSFIQSTDGTYAGEVSGSGSLIKSGAGTLTLSGANIYTGGTTVTAGTLRGSTNSLPGNIIDNAALILDQSSDGTFAGDISGTGTVEKAGNGTLIFTGNHIYTGLTTISAGRLDIDNAVSGDVLVQAPGSLGGQAGFIGGNLTANGTVAPGAAGGIDALIILGDVAFQGGSVFEVDLDEAGSADALIVTGNATIDGASVVPRPVPGDYLTPLSLSILSAATVTGDFSIASPLAFFDTQLQPVPGGLNLLVSFSAAKAAGLAQTPNQRAVAPSASQLLQMGSTDPGVTALRGVGEAAFPAALDALAGEQLTQFATTHFSIAQRFSRTLQGRIRGISGRDHETLLGGPQGPRPARGSGGADDLEPAWVVSVAPTSALAAASTLGALSAAVRGQGGEDTGWGAWFDGYGNIGDVDADSGTSELDYTIWGASFGLDYRLTDRFLVGAGVGYANSDLDFDDRPGTNEADTYQGSLYAGYATPLFYLGLAGRYATSSHDTSRRITFPGFDATADADFDGDEFGGHLYAGINAFDFGSMALQLVGSLDYVQLDQDGYTESGAGAFNLAVENETTDSLLAGLGVRLHGAFEMEGDLWIAPELRARFLHEAGDEERQISARFASLGTGTAFTIEGSDAPTSSVQLGFGWTVTAGDDFSVFLDYDARLSSEQIDHTAAFGVRVVW